MNPGSSSSSVWIAALRTRVHSVVSETNNLFLIIGPPAEKPNWLRVYWPFGTSATAFAYVLAGEASRRLNSHAEPRKSLGQGLVVTLTTPPEARPYSAEKFLVTMPNP